MRSARPLLSLNKPLIGMVHVRALPGTPFSKYNIDRIAQIAADEALQLANAGFDALIIENMHDRPYLLRTVGPEITAAMTRVGLAVRSATPDLPLGVQILAGANKEALAIALAIDAHFIRAESFIFSSVADEGLFSKADAAELLRERTRLGAEHIQIFADIKKKHSSHAITADLDIAETARAAEFFGAQALIITGASTASPTDQTDLDAATNATNLPIIVGSGATAASTPHLLNHADALIIGSDIKQQGLWSNPIDPDRAAAIIASSKK